jgi:hypothetical protein
VIAVAWAVVAGCTTTTRLGPAGDAATSQTIEDLAARPDAYARVAAGAPVLQPIADEDAPHPILGHEPGWLTLSEHGPVRVPLVQLRSVSTYDHARGAIDGALAAGGVGFVLGFAAGTYAASQSTCAVDAPCQRPSNVVRGLEVGAVVGLITGGLGATVGAVIGHERRYEMASP